MKSLRHCIKCGHAGMYGKDVDQVGAKGDLKFVCIDARECANRRRRSGGDAVPPKDYVLTLLVNEKRNLLSLTERLKKEASDVIERLDQLDRLIGEEAAGMKIGQEVRFRPIPGIPWRVVKVVSLESDGIKVKFVVKEVGGKKQEAKGELTVGTVKNFFSTSKGTK